MLNYTVWVNDDRFELKNKPRMTAEEIAEELGIDIEDLVQIDFEDAE